MEETKATSLIDLTLDCKVVLSTVLEFISDGILVVGDDNMIRLINAYAETLLGVKTRDVIGKSIDGLLTLEDDSGNTVPVEKHPWQIARNQKNSVGPMHFTIIKSNGEKTPVTLSVAPLFSLDKSIVSGVAIAFEDRTTEAEVERMKTQFIPFAAHQLRTPLGSTRWNTEMILSGKLGAIPYYLKDTIGNIYDSTQQMIRLVNDLLNLSRIDEGKIPNDPVEIDIGSVVRSVVRETQLLAEKRALTFNVSIPESLPKLKLDASRFRDVIQNVTSNAVKFNVPGGKITISVGIKDNNVEFIISDSGMGIPKEEQKRIFEKFFRAKNAVANQTEGTGLGLYVIKYYMDEWGGSITIESEENKGTTVRLRFPMKPNDSTH